MNVNELYLDLLKRSLTDCIHTNKQAEYSPLSKWPSLGNKTARFINKFLEKRHHAIVRARKYCFEERLNGLDRPANGETMIGLLRLNNLESCIRQIVKANVPGDLIETGSWRGGATIFMRAVLDVLGATDRRVIVADSFQGLPKADAAKYPVDRGDPHHADPFLSISLEEVKQNFKNYNLLGDNVMFLQGWFKDTLPNAPIQALSLIRLDGDMYESTMDALVALYPKLSKGGYLIVDDWALVGARAAINDYRKQHSINDEIIPIDRTGAYWQKT